MPENMKSLNGYGFDASMLNGKTASEYASAESVSKLKDDLFNLKNELIVAEQSENIFDKDNVKDGKYIGYTEDWSISYISNSAFSCALVSVENGKTYTSTVLSYTALGFDKDLKFVDNVYIVSGGSVEKVSFTINNPSIAYVSINFRPAYWSKDTFMVVEGTTYPDAYIPYCYKKVLADSIYPNDKIIDAVKGIEYYVGYGENDGITKFSSLVDCLYAVQNSKAHSIVNIASGTYDILEELGGESYINSINPSTQTYMEVQPYVDDVEIIGHGNVILTMDLSNITDGSKRWMFSPLNVQGNVSVTNITINAIACRYCIHDDSGIRMPNTVRYYKNVRLYCSGGTNKPYASGYSDYTSAYFDDCYFETTLDNNAWSCHANHNCYVSFNNCIFKNADGWASLRLSQNGQVRLNAKICNCYMQYGLLLKAESDNFSGYGDTFVELINTKCLNLVNNYSDFRGYVKSYNTISGTVETLA